MSDAHPMVDFNTYKYKNDAAAVEKEISEALNAAGIAFRVQVNAVGEGFQIDLLTDCYPHNLFDAVPLEVVASWRCRRYGFSGIEGVSADAIELAVARVLAARRGKVAEDKRMEAILTAFKLAYNRFLERQRENRTVH